jgi:hypothetical protein
VRQEVRLQDPTQHAGAGTSATTPEVLPHQHLPVQLYKGVTVEDVTVSAPGAGKGVVVPCLRLPGSNFTIQLRNIRKRLLYIRFCLGRDIILSVSREKTNTRVIRCSYGPVFPQCDAPTEPPRRATRPHRGPRLPRPRRRRIFMVCTAGGLLPEWGACGSSFIVSEDGYGV